MTRSPSLTALGALALLIALGSCGGCAWRTPAASDRAAIAPGVLIPIEWPARRTHDLDRLRDLSPTALTSTFTIEHGAGEASHRTTNIVKHYAVNETAVAGVGLIRALSELDGDDEPVANDNRELQFISYELSDEPAERIADGGVINQFDFVFSPERLEVFEPNGDIVRGLAVCIQAYGQTEYEEAVIEELRSRGWMIVQTSFITFLSDDHEVLIERGDEAELDAAAEAIASFVDQQLARTAYASAGGVAYLRAVTPALRDRPVVVLGFSAGALATPTVLAHQPDLYDAAVIVAGGANLLDISTRSARTNGGIDLSWRDPTLERAHRDDLVDRYLARTHLDPWHTAPHVRGVPILQLHGAFDRVVPASAGDHLHERLGRPECWTYPGGHGLVFWMLPREARRIADWIERTVEKGDA